MEFEYIVDFFSSLNYVKRKYPMIVTYVNKYLNTLEDENAKFKEINHLRRFLIINPEIKNKIFTNSDFKTGKQSLTLVMDNFLIGTQEQIDQFWDKLIQLENILFPDGKPEPFSSEKKSSETSTFSGISGAMALLESSPVFSDVIDQVKASVANMGDNTDINAIMEMPDFKQMVESIKSGLTSGKYKLKDLTTTVGTIIDSVQDDLDDDTRETLKAVTDTMNAVERGETPNIARMLNAVTNLKIKQ
jgi:hypothetical protein